MSGDSPLRVVTLCTGNAARSVMAGAMLSAAVAEGTPLEIVTAGTHVLEGRPVSGRTQRALDEVGLSAGGHRSHQVTDGDLDRADLVLTMASEHTAYVRRRHPAVAARTATVHRLVRDLPPGPGPLPDRLAALDLASVSLEPWEDVADPAGGEDEVYVACARELLTLIGALAPRLSDAR